MELSDPWLICLQNATVELLQFCTTSSLDNKLKSKLKNWKLFDVN